MDVLLAVPGCSVLSGIVLYRRKGVVLSGIKKWLLGEGKQNVSFFLKVKSSLKWHTK